MSQSRPPARFVFWARHANDIDHVTPIIHALLEQGVSPERIRYVASCPCPSIMPWSNLNLGYLAGRGVRLETPHLRTKWRKVLLDVSQREWKAKPLKALSFLAKQLYWPVVDWGRAEQWPNWRYAHDLLDQVEPGGVFVFDQVAAPFHKKLTGAARERKGVHSIAVTHGFELHRGLTRNPRSREEQVRVASARHELFRGYERLLMPNVQSMRTFGLDTASDWIKIMGSIRYCPEWQPMIRRLNPPPVFPGGGSRLKVLYLAGKSGVDICGKHVEILDFAEQMRMMRFMEEHPGIDLTIKLNPRGLGLSPEQAREFNALDCRKVAGQHSTPSLVSWADAVVTTYSSVTLEAFLQNKPVLYTDYATFIDSAYREYGAGACVTSFARFAEVLESLVEDPGRELYPVENVERLFDEFVYGGTREPRIMDRYADYLLALSEGAA